MTDALSDLLDYLPGLRTYLEDPAISELMLTPLPGDPASAKLFVERRGLIEETPVVVSAQRLRSSVIRLAEAHGKWISDQEPLLEVRLKDGSRVAAVWPGVSVRGLAVTIRRFPAARYSAADLVALKMMPAAQMDYMALAVIARKNILISGGTGSGKTSLLNALAEFIPDNERIVVIEDVAEIVLPSTKRNTLRLEGRRGTPEAKEISLRDLVATSLRHRPDRLILGEVRGAEAFDLLQVLNSGHEGTMSTIHAVSASAALQRLTDLALIAGVLPPASVCAEIGQLVDYVVQLARDREGRRTVRELLRVVGYENGRFEVVEAAWKAKAM